MSAAILRRPRAALALVAAAIAAAVIASALIPDRLQVAGFTDPDSDSARALDQMRQALGFDPEPGMLVLATSEDGFSARSGRRAIAGLAATLRRDPAVGRVRTAFGAEALPPLLSADGTKTLLLVHFRSSDLDELEEPIDRIREQLHAPGVELAYSGYPVGFIDANRIARDDLVRAELIAFPVIAVLLLVIFRGFAAAAVPLVIGAASVAGTVACLRLLGEGLDISVFALNLAALLGLGLAVDYGLLLVSRFREEAATRGLGAETVRAVIATAGRTVAFSGCAVAGACAALLLFPQGFIYSMGIAGVFVSLFSAAAALVITPPLLLLAGHRIAARAVAPEREDSEQGRWYRWADWVTRRHVEVAIAGVAILVAAAAPALGLMPTLADDRTIPRGHESREVAEVIKQDFSPYLGYPVNVAIDAADGPVSPDLAVVGLVGRAGVVGFDTSSSPSGETIVVHLVLAEPFVSDASQQFVEEIREGPGPALVAGRAAEFVDLKDSIVDRAPVAFALAALTTIVVVFLMTGSLVLPVKALLFSVLSVGAVFGLLVLIFQEQALGIAGLLGYEGPEAIETTASVVIIVSTFGLATDYSILLLSRISEEHEAGRSDEEAVALGIQRSGPVITSAALLLAVALLALASSQIFLVKQLTVGQALGVLIDASLVRMLLVPAFMRILGRANWWAPRPLLRLRARLRNFAH